MRTFYKISVIIFICITAIMAERYPGYYINKSNVRVVVDFEVKSSFTSGDIDYYKIQNKIKYYDENNKLQTLKPEMTSEFAFKVYSQPTVFLSIKNTVGAGSIFSGEYIFAERVIDGKLKLLRVREKKSTPGFYNSTSNMMLGGSVEMVDKYILQKVDSEPVMPSLITFRKRVAEYLSDCSDISVKIENRLYTIKDIYRVVEEYNAGCK